MIAKRIFDIIFSLFGLVVLSPLFLVIAFLIVLDSKGGIFFLQERIGRYGQPFKIFKFRTMYKDAEKKGQLTVGSRDPRITKVGYWLRKTKMDELPQLINVLKGDMSFVGPRPEVKKYVDLYNEEQKQVLNVRPGITDFASIVFRNENDLLAGSNDPERLYVEKIMPTKLKLNMKYIEDRNLLLDVKIILKTVFNIF